jgi:AcrR family transcriptional regulator
MSDIESRMAGRREQIIRAARDVFLRYGLARTTMGDLATAAGVSRPTLYGAFGDKTAIFQAVLDDLVNELIVAIEAGLPDHASLEDKLFFACTTWATDGFERIRTYPDSRDLIDTARPMTADAYRTFGALLAKVLRDAGAGSPTFVDDMANMMYAAVNGFQGSAADRGELWKMIRSLSIAVANASAKGP